MNNSDNACVCFTCKDVKMTLLKGKHSLLRYLGFIAALFASLQALIWIGMCISGIVCFYIKCGMRQPANRFGKAFYNIYLSTNLSQHYPHIVTPIFLHVLFWFFMILLAVWLLASVRLIVDYRKWAKAKKLRISSKRWIIVTIIVCILDLLLFVLFVVDFSMLKTGNIGASVRSMNEEDYDDGDIRPYEPPNTFDEFYDSDRDTLGNDTFPGTTALSQEPGVTGEESSTPALTYKERLQQIEEMFARKNADVDDRIKELLAQAKLIRETELGTHYNPYVRAKAAKLRELLALLEKLYGAQGKTEDELNKERMLAEKRKQEEQSATATEEATTQAVATETEANEDTASDEHYLSDDTYQNDREDPGNILKEIDKGDFEEDLDSSDNARRDLDRLLHKLKESMKDTDAATKIKDSGDDTDSFAENQANARRNLDRLLRKFKESMKDTNAATKITDSGDETDSFAENQANSRDAEDDYNDLRRSTFQDDDYGIILQNDGPGTGWRKISSMSQGSATGADVMLAPSAMLMTLAIRGYVLWIVNLTAALMLLYLYITRPKRPTLLTRLQA